MNLRRLTDEVSCRCNRGCLKRARSTRDTRCQVQGISRAELKSEPQWYVHRASGSGARRLRAASLPETDVTRHAQDPIYMQELGKIKTHLEEGVLTEVEFNTKKAKLIEQRKERKAAAQGDVGGAPSVPDDQAGEDKTDRIRSLEAQVARLQAAVAERDKTVEELQRQGGAKAPSATVRCGSGRSDSHLGGRGGGSTQPTVSKATDFDGVSTNSRVRNISVAALVARVDTMCNSLQAEIPIVGGATLLPEYSDQGAAATSAKAAAGAQSARGTDDTPSPHKTVSRAPTAVKPMQSPPAEKGAHQGVVLSGGAQEGSSSSSRSLSSTSRKSPGEAGSSSTSGAAASNGGSSAKSGATRCLAWVATSDAADWRGVPSIEYEESSRGAEVKKLSASPSAEVAQQSSSAEAAKVQESALPSVEASIEGRSSVARASKGVEEMIIMRDHGAMYEPLIEVLRSRVAKGRVLILVEHWRPQSSICWIKDLLCREGFPTTAMDKYNRCGDSKELSLFKDGGVSVLVTSERCVLHSDRGLPELSTVISLDGAQTIEYYNRQVNLVTSSNGLAVTFLQRHGHHDQYLAAEIAQAFRDANKEVPEWLEGTASTPKVYPGPSRSQRSHAPDGASPPKAYRERHRDRESLSGTGLLNSVMKYFSTRSQVGAPPAFQKQVAPQLVSEQRGRGEAPPPQAPAPVVQNLKPAPYNLPGFENVHSLWEYDKDGNEVESEDDECMM